MWKFKLVFVNLVHVKQYHDFKPDLRGIMRDAIARTSLPYDCGIPGHFASKMSDALLHSTTAIVQASFQGGVNRTINGESRFCLSCLDSHVLTKTIILHRFCWLGHNAHVSPMFTLNASLMRAE